MFPIKRHLCKVFVFLLVPLLLVACGDSDSVNSPEPSTAATPYVPIHYKTIQLPDNARPLYSSWSPDGDYIIFGSVKNGEVYTVDRDGSNVQCLTCSIDKNVLPKIYSAFAYVFPDNKRVLIAQELGSEVYVLQCTPTVKNCNQKQVFPVVLSADHVAGKVDVQRRTYHLAPDGKHLAYTKVRTDNMLMLVGTLKKEGQKYILQDPKVINPTGPTGPNDPHVAGWTHLANMWEFKSFADGGKSALIVGEGTGFDPDTYKINLATGRLTSMASSPDWDEDGAISPDGKYFALASWRTMNRLRPLGLMPLAKDFFGYPLTAVLAFYYVSNFQGFKCDLQPWLLPGDGDHNGQLVGQPLAPYTGGDIVPANNLVGQPMWSPDGTRILLRMHSTQVPPASANDTLKVKGMPPHSLTIAKLDIKPTQPHPAVKTVVGNWATTPADYNGPFFSQQTISMRGSNSGSINVNYAGNLLNANYSVTYNNYSEDGKTFLSGTTTFTGNVQKAINFKVDLTATDADGKTIGSQQGDLHFVAKDNPSYTELPWTKSGTITTKYKGKTASGLPKAGGCKASLPTPSPLIVKHSANGGALQIQVSADIHGDKRPVMNADVTVDGNTVKTDAAGVATFRGVSSGAIQVHVTAGDTFKPAQLTINS